MPRCQSKQALLRGLRPCPQMKVHLSLCSRRCLSCDIWKLASLVYTHMSLSSRMSTTPEKLRAVSSEPSYDYAKLEKQIEAAFMREQFHLGSIMSMATFEGAGESTGLRLAYQRCLSSVSQLLELEEKLELAIIRPPTPDHTQYRRRSNAQHYYEARRPSFVSVA